MNYRILWISLACVFIFSMPTFANTVDAGGEAYGNGDYAKAVQIMMLPENIDDPRAQYVIGLAYRDGKGVEQSYSEAAKWWSSSGEEGRFPRALYGLAILYRDGNGVPQSHKKSFKLATQSAEADTGEPYAFIGNAYRFGIGTARSDIMAMEYFEKAYFKKNFEGLETMADMYRYGLGGPKNSEIAAYMYQKHFERFGRKSSRRNLMTLAGEGVEYAQYAELFLGTDRTSQQWISRLEALANRGNSYAQCNIGLKYFKGEVVSKNLPNAMIFFERSAASGNLCGIYRLGSLYANGTGVVKNQNRAIKLFERAINDSYNYPFNHPQKSTVWREHSEKAVEVVNDQKERARMEALNRETRANNARVRAETARRRQEYAARRAAEKQEYEIRCIRRRYVCRDAMAMSNYEVCEYKDVDICLKP